MSYNAEGMPPRYEPGVQGWRCPRCGAVRWTIDEHWSGRTPECYCPGLPVPPGGCRWPRAMTRLGPYDLITVRA